MAKKYAKKELKELRPEVKRAQTVNASAEPSQPGNSPSLPNNSAPRIKHNNQCEQLQYLRTCTMKNEKTD